MQIDEQALAIGYHVGITAVSVVGGVDMRPQERALRAGAEIVVATPGRLLDHMRFGYVDFQALEVLVLDEADRMLDMGFLPDIRRILRALPPERQTLMFSATMASEIRQLANDILRDPVPIVIGGRAEAGERHRAERLSGGAGAEDGVADDAPAAPADAVGPGLRQAQESMPTGWRARSRAAPRRRPASTPTAAKRIASPRSRRSGAASIRC